MDLPLIAAGAIALLGAVIHGAAGEVIVVRKLSPELLPGSRFGGPRMTKTMIQVTWHLTTVAFLTVGLALVLAGSALDGDAAEAIALLGAAAATGFAGVMVGLAVATQGPRALLRHLGPLLFTVAAALAWWGAL